MNAALGVLFAFFDVFAMPSCAPLIRGRQSQCAEMPLLELIAHLVC
jgi:hypothetical protein